MADARRYGVLFGLALWLSGAGVRAGGNDRPDAFRSGVDLVTVDVCVRDAAGRFLPTLSADDFLILENGSLQRVAFLTPGQALPLRVVLVIDASNSMNGAKLARAREAAAQFAARLAPEDQLEIVADYAEELGSGLIVLLVAVVGGYILWKYVARRRFVKRLHVMRIAPEELKARLDAGEDVLVVDVRDRLDFVAEPSIIPGHVSIPYDWAKIAFCNPSHGK